MFCGEMRKQGIIAVQCETTALEACMQASLVQCIDSFSPLEMLKRTTKQGWGPVCLSLPASPSCLNEPFGNVTIQKAS